MAKLPAVPSPLAVLDGGRKKRAGLPKLFHKFFFKLLRLRSAKGSASAFEAYYGYRVADEYYYYSYGGAGSSWAGVLSSIPEEESPEEGTPDAVIVPGALRKAHSERFVAAEAAAVVHLEVVL